ncbi:hypothetical protein AMTRI_Chr01g108010 [Amborella trichopoda]
MQERREKGLCSNCNDKFVPSHRCKNLFLIEGYEEDDGDPNQTEDYLAETDDTSEISLHGMWGVQSPKTMHVKGRICGVPVTVLVDSGSTHNFLSETLAKEMEIRPIMDSRFEVIVASGEKLPCPGKCSNVTLFLQGVPMKIDFICFR